METKLHKSTRGIWIFIDGKHKKTVPSKYENCIANHIDKLDLKRKYLSVSEIELLEIDQFNKTLSSFLKTIETNEPHLYRLIASAKTIGTRLVKTRTGTRYELCFDNKLKIKCSKTIFHKSPNKLPIAHLNY